MKKAVVLVIGAVVYLWFVQVGKDVAMRELNHVENLYTTAGAQASAIASSNR